MSRSAISAIGLAGVLVTVCAQHLVAQQAQEPVRSLALTFGQNFRATDNLDLDPNSAGTTLRATTRLGISAEIRNEVTQLSLESSAGVDLIRDPDGSNRTEADRPRLEFSYNRDGASTSLTASASYRSDQIAFIRPLEDFLNPDGTLDLPEDALDLEGDGWRTDYDADIAVTLRRDAPLSFTLSAGFDRRNYQDVTSTSLFDSATDRIGASARLILDPATTMNLSYSGSWYSAEDTQQTERDSRNVKLGFSRALSPVLSMNASIGYSRLETEENNITTTDETQTVGLGLSLDRPNGTISTSFNTALTPSGERLTYQLSRSLALPGGDLNATIGATKLSGGDDFDPTLSISYRHDLPSGALSVSLNRTVSYNETEDRDLIATTFATTYSYEINPVSSLSLRGAYSERDDVDRSDLSVGYSYALTEDWSLNTGYSYQQRSEQTGTADSHAVFLNLGRRFDLPF